MYVEDLSANGGGLIGHGCGFTPQQSHGRIGCVVTEANFLRAGPFTELTGETFAVDSAVD